MSKEERQQLLFKCQSKKTNNYGFVVIFNFMFVHICTVPWRVNSLKCNEKIVLNSKCC